LFRFIGTALCTDLFVHQLGKSGRDSPANAPTDTSLVAIKSGEADQSTRFELKEVTLIFPLTLEGDIKVFVRQKIGPALEVNVKTNT
jgi:hypothetical protein